VHVFFSFFLLSQLAELFLFSAVSLSLSLFFLIALALYVCLGVKKMTAQTSLPRRATAGVGAAAHNARKELTSVH
jgi:Mn2+/Fe2+ NRAMP family transporter